ncbi:MAG: DUF2442 domain-containing protein [Thermoanaerobaculia bacterium]
MAHPIHRVTAVEVIGRYRLSVEFADGLSGQVDLEPILRGEIYGPLRDPDLFAQAAVDPEVHTVVWSNGADFDPAILHDWPEHEEAMKGLAQQWDLASV